MTNYEKAKKWFFDNMESIQEAGTPFSLTLAQDCRLTDHSAEYWDRQKKLKDLFRDNLDIYKILTEIMYIGRDGLYDATKTKKYNIKKCSDELCYLKIPRGSSTGCSARFYGYNPLNEKNVNCVRSYLINGFTLLDKCK